MDKLDLEKIYELEDELRELQTEVKAMASQVKAKHGEEEHEVERQGETVTLTEEDLWNELQDPTATEEGKKQAREILKEEHETLFEKLEEEQELSKAVNKQFTETFGFSFKSISPARLTKIIEEFVDYFLDKKLD